uniref:[histone H3]-lysine(36) N-trimethyltransferase n=1 Tax=Glossina brevipalpis TaxID=37001 RepID=A0A1A9X5E3_9MUSC
MDSNLTAVDTGAGRKRTKRPQTNKNENNANNKIVTQPQFLAANNQKIEGSTLDVNHPGELSLTNSNNNSNNNTTVECRRSSRKKVIKFDVRDLLNKNRKPHKIQIEARIDSNAPSTNKVVSRNLSSEGLSTTFTGTSSSEEISVKKKNFMEKSAFFRRFSISTEQPKQPPQLPIPPVLLNKSPVIQDCIEQMKIKPNSSLILAQMESTSSVAGFTRKQAAFAKLLESEKLPKRTEETIVAAPQQRKRGRPPKVKTAPLTSHSNGTGKISQISKSRDDISQLTPEKARNWKEYKAALQQTTTTKDLPTESTTITTNVVNEVIAVPITPENPADQVSVKVCEKIDDVVGNFFEPDVTEVITEEIVTESIDSSELGEPSNFGASIEQEVRCLSPISASIEKMSLSRTSSSSESENCSERSINSSGGSSSRSYRYGDELRVNLKRISLHKTKLNSIASDSNQQLETENYANEEMKTEEKDTNIISTADIAKNLLLEWEEDFQETLTNEKKEQLGENRKVMVNVTEDKQISDNLVESRFEVEEVFGTKQSLSNSNLCNVEEIIKGTEISSEANVIIIDDSSISNSEIYMNLKPMNTAEDKHTEFNQPSLENEIILSAGQDLQDPQVINTIEKPKQADTEIINEYSPVSRENTTDGIIQETTAVSSTVLNEELITEAIVIPINPTQEEVPIVKDRCELLKDCEFSVPRKAPELASTVTEDIKHIVTIPKKRGRRPRFRNLHEPELQEKVADSTIISKEIVESSISNDFDLRTIQNAAEYNINMQPPLGTKVMSSQILHIPIQTSEYQCFTKDSLTKSTVSEEYDEQLARNADIVKTTECEEENESIKTEHQLIHTDITVEESSELQTEETKDSKLSDVNSALEIESISTKVATDPRSEDVELKEENKSVNTALTNEREPNLLGECEVSNTESKDSSFPLALGDNCQTLRPEIDTNVIHQVDIETNMLLDILRQVQTNTEANELRVKNKTCTDSNIEAPNAESVFPSEGKQTSSNLWKKIDTDSTSSNGSTARSETESPLSFKKVIRRCDRRSGRSEESKNKTLEETFAEITALSSKIILQVAVCDLPDDKKDVVEIGECIKKCDAETLDEEPLLRETKNFTESEKILTAATEVNFTVSLEQPKHQEAKAAMGKRGRKPKNKPIVTSLPIITSTEEIGSKNHENVDNVEAVEESTKCNKISAKNVLIPVPDENVMAFQSENEKLKDVCKKQQVSSSKEKISEESSIDSDKEKISGECSIDPNFLPHNFDNNLNASRGGHSTIRVVNENNISKHSDKKRDSSTNRNQDAKNSTKRQLKKSKNNQEDVLSLTKGNVASKSLKLSCSAPRRGRKPKNQSNSVTEQPSTASITKSGKKKGKKDAKIITVENSKKQHIALENLEGTEKNVNTENFSPTVDPILDEKSAKRKRQKKLKDDFQAALIDDFNNKEPLTLLMGLNEPTYPVCSPKVTKEPLHTETIRETISVSTVCNAATPDTEEDPDPLKDIEKFIEAGVNLLKKDYKIDEDSMDGCIRNKSTNEEATAENVSTEPGVLQAANKLTEGYTEVTNVVNIFETPADTPTATPSATPPPKSPNDSDAFITPDVEEISGVRRSHRIKQITKAPKALVGRGLVRDRERFSIKDDVETKSHYTLDDHLTDLAEVEAKNAKFLKEMEERLSNFHVIKENEYKCERVISREARKMICDCFLTAVEEERGELGCGEDCLNRLLMIECGSHCNVKERCTNKRFQKFLCSPCRVFRTEKKGFGIMADIEILPGEFIMEYVGEVIDSEEFENRRITYSRDKNRHYYFMALRSDAIIDATIKGNISRFINHSCDPNAETQKWTVNGELRIGFFSLKSIMPGEEITFDYQYQRYGREAQRCYCESTSCRGWIGQEPTSDEGEQIDEESDEEEEEEPSHLLVPDDDDEDDDSDASIADPEEVQKKLEMAAAQAEAELGSITIEENKLKGTERSTLDDIGKKEDKGDAGKVSQTEIEIEDSKSKFKKLLSKVAEKVAAKQKQNKRQQKLERKRKTKNATRELGSNKQRFLEDPDIEDEVEFLKRCGLKNQSDTLRLSRLMVRAKLVETRLNLLEILRKGELPCRRLFLDYHGLRLVHGWMREDEGNMQIRLALLQTLETLPITNKTVLTDTKVLQVVRNWCGPSGPLSPNDDSSKESCGSGLITQDDRAGHTVVETDSELAELEKLCYKLVATWDGLPEIFRIPKKERIEQMKEHEREADRQYAATAESEANKNFTDRYQRDRFGRGTTSSAYNRFVRPNSTKATNASAGGSNTNRVSVGSCNSPSENIKNLSKAQRREMFAAKVAREEADKRLAEERREFEIKCRFFGLDSKKTRPQDIPFCVNPQTGQWYSMDRKPIPTPPSYAHIQVPVKPKSTDPADYQLPAVVATLPPSWKFAITPQGKIYYYHIKYRISQWEPPTPPQRQNSEIEECDGDSDSEVRNPGDISEDEDDILIGMDESRLKAYIEKKVEDRRQKRYQRLVDERAISPRREEDRIYNQLEVRKYKENKEKIRKRKEEIRRKRAEALRQTAANPSNLGVTSESSNAANKSQNESSDQLAGVLPIQDYLLSSDEEEIDIKTECNNSPLIDKIVEGDKIVDELDALTTKRTLKRVLPPHRGLEEVPTSSASTITAPEKAESKKRKMEKKDKRKNKEGDAKYRKLKEKFRCEIAGIIVHHLKPYRNISCNKGRIKSSDDFNHLARKLTHFVMIKELKYCESVGQTLVVTESVKNKSREFIKKYMAKYGEAYVKPSSDPEFKNIPYTL